MLRLCLPLTLVLACAVLAVAEEEPEQIFSGPQAGEKTPGFKVYDVNGPNRGKEVDYVSGFDKGPALILFVHELTRPGARVIRGLDEYAWRKRDFGLNSLFVVLSDDQDHSERRLPIVARSIRLKNTLSISVDGIEGPGAYGLNREVQLTAIVARHGVVTNNFAILSPNETDLPPITKALDQLLPDKPIEPVLETPEQMRAEILRLRRTLRRMEDEMADLRRQLQQVRQGRRGGRMRGRQGQGQNLPGSSPKDPQLTGLVRQLINRQSTEDETKTAAEKIFELTKDNEALRKEAAGVLVRVLHLGYGTEHGKAQMKALQKRLEAHEHGGMKR